MSKNLTTHAEYVRGYQHGYAAGQEMRAKYGRAFADHQHDQLVRNARRRGIDVDEHAFDKGYAAGYKAGATTR